MNQNIEFSGVWWIISWGLLLAIVIAGLLATLSELKIREDLGVSSGREKRMVWEAARQLRFWRAIMLRRDRAYLFQASQ